MMTKWEWIANEVRELGYQNLAKMALIIDKHIAEIYGEGKVTECWYEIYDEMCDILQTPKLIYDTIHESAFCYPCNDSDIRQLACVDCKYGKKYGVCGNKKSEFGIFCNIFFKIFKV